MKKISVYILICIAGAMSVACTKGSSTLNGADTVEESLSEQPVTGTESSQEQITKAEAPSETESEAPTETETDATQETIVKYKLNTVEALEDDGKEMSAAEALRSTMKGKRSALELFEDDRLFYLERSGINIYPSPKDRDSIEDISDTGLARVNMLDYNRGGFLGGITPNAAEWKNFVSVDLDRDGIKEVIVYGEPYIVLHYTGNEVYMTSIYSRIVPYKVYENGIWETSSGAFDRQFYRLYPAKGAIYREELIYEYIVPEGMDTSHNVYRIMCKDVTEEELNAYIDELIGGLTPLEWHEFTEENIDKYVVD